MDYQDSTRQREEEKSRLEGKMHNIIYVLPMLEIGDCEKALDGIIAAAEEYLFLGCKRN